VCIGSQDERRVLPELSRDFKAEIERSEVIKVLEDDKASVAESLPSAEVAELPVRTRSTPGEVKSPAVFREVPWKYEAEERTNPPKG